MQQHPPSIFAHDLAVILQQHQYPLKDLRRQPFSLDSKKIERLERSLYDSTLLPALNHGELMTIVLQLKLTEEERLRLYAALIALGTQRLLLEYLIPQRAWEIACEVRNAALVWLLDHHNSDDLFPRRRSLRVLTEGTESMQENVLFSEALDAYDEGTQFHVLALFRSDGSGHALLEHALLCLERANALLQLMPASQQAIEEWQYWYTQVTKDLILLHEELD